MANVMVISVKNRSKNATDVQNLLTKYGCNIKVRLGMHEAGDVCTEEGLIILQLVGEKDTLSVFHNELNALEGVKSGIMEI